MSSLKRTPSQTGSQSGESSTSSRRIRSTSARDIDPEFIPLVYKILRNIEAEPKDQAQRVKECRNITQVSEELQQKFDLVRNQIKKLPGIDFNKEDQLKNVRQLQKQLKLKKELISKYRDMAHLP